MRNKSLSVATLLVAVVAGAVFAPGASARTSLDSEVYYTCPAGYAFETSGAAARCKKPQWTETKAFVGCALGMTLRYDVVGNTDMCSATNPVTGVVSVEPGCYPSDLVGGFTKRHVTGKDFCGKNHPQEIMPPSRAVVR